MTLPELDYSRSWQREPVAIGPRPHPAPEVPARAAAPEETPAGARRVAKAATAAGWVVRATYARGTTIDRAGHPGALIHSLALRMALPGTRHRAAAVWTSPAISGPLKWSIDSAYAYLMGDGMSARLIPLTAGKKDPAALNLAAYLADPSRLTDALTVIESS